MFAFSDLGFFSPGTCPIRLARAPGVRLLFQHLTPGVGLLTHVIWQIPTLPREGGVGDFIDTCITRANQQLMTDTSGRNSSFTSDFKVRSREYVR